MNPLNPWVALTEIGILLALAFGGGWLVAMLQYQNPIKATRQRIEDLQKALRQHSVRQRGRTTLP